MIFAGRLFTICIYSMIWITASVTANSTHINTYSDMVHTVNNLNSPQAFIAGTFFIAGALVFGCATHYCWDKTRYWVNRVDQNYEFYSRAHLRTDLMTVFWAGATCLGVIHTGIFSLVALNCFFRIFQINLAQR